MQRLHPDIEREYGYAPVLSQADVERLWAVVCAWVTRRANELCLGGATHASRVKPQKFALIKACAESGASFSREQIDRMWETNQQELEDLVKCPIVVVSEKEAADEIEKARVRGDLFQQVRW